MALLAFFPVALGAQPLPYQDRTLPAEERAADLVGRLTLEEKAALMRYDSPAVERLGIPAYNWWNEALHGVARNGAATVYPMPIGMAASFDVRLLEEVFTSVSDEARVKYRLARTVENPENYWYKGLTFWTPNINIFRDPRWGRGMETYGEDPYLTGQLGMAVVRGLQGDRSDGSMKAQACAKHFAVHSGPEPARHSFDAVVSERDLRETYLPAFKDLVTKAGVDEVMFAYNRFEGVPCGASERLLRDILRNEYGFKGIIVSDCWAVSDFVSGHKWSKDGTSAVAAAINAGMDLECGQLTPLAPKAVELGLLDESTIDERVTRLLTVRFRLGEIDFDSPWDAVPESDLCSEAHAAQALRMAREGVVLLKNDGILPLKKGVKVALVGPNAADSVMMWGNYNGFPSRTVTLLDALRQHCDVKFVEGCPYVDGLDPGAKTVSSLVKEIGDSKIVIFAGGISPRLEGEELKMDLEGFYGGDRTSIELPAVQRNLVRSLVRKGKKVIFVNFSGSAVALSPEAEVCDAILQAWYPGQEGGTALAEVLFGDCNPSGKLPVTFYAGDSQLPPFEDYSMEGRTYRYFKGEPLFPFGHGLSYTVFEYSSPVVSPDGKSLAVEVANTGSMDGDEVVQLYLSREDDPEGPVKALRGFRRVSVPAGSTARVEFPLDASLFTWWNPSTSKMEYMTGGYVLHVGGSSADASLRSLRIRVR